MSNVQSKLTVKGIEAIKPDPARRTMHGDGGGLWLVVEKAGARWWMFKYSLGGRRREMSLGAFPLFSLAEAREARDAAAKQVAQGVDPIDARRAAEAEAAAAKAAEAQASAVPFFEAYAIVVANRLALKRERTRELWKAQVGPANTPLLTGKRVNEIVTADVIATLEPIMAVHPVKAGKLRQKIEQILDVARAAGHMGPIDQPYQNPARWVGHLRMLLPARKKRRVKHHTALHYNRIGGFMAALAKKGGLSARLLEFTILTVPRGHESRHMRIRDLDLVEKTWTVPDEDHKTSEGFVTPLSDAALAVLAKVLPLHGETPDPQAFVFPCLEGGQPWKPLSSKVMGRVIDAMGYRGQATPHGFRSTFRDWAGNETDIAHDVCEQCLSHAVGDQTERAYRRMDALAKKRRALELWAARCGNVKADKVVEMRKAAA